MATTTPNYTIDYEDPKFTEVKEAEDKALTDVKATYGTMIENAESMYDGLKESAEKWGQTQTDIQNQQTEFTIQQIEKEKEYAEKDYQKEQAGAYVDWRKQSNQYGTEAEKMASAGLANTGYSESSQVSMYNAYQNRVAVARESFQRSWDNYNNKIAEARMQNNAALAEIATQVFEKQAELTLQAFQYKNQLISELFDREMQTKQFYADQWQNVLSQMNTENALAENIRQFNENQKWQTEQNALDREHQLARDKEQREFEAAQAELNRKHDMEMLDAKTEKEKELLEIQHQKDLEKLKKQHEYNLAQLDKQLANEKAMYAYQQSYKGTTFSGGSTGGSKGGSTTTSKSSGGSGLGKFYTTAAGGTSKTPTQNSLTFKGAPVDMQSVINLGYGPISASKLATLISQGKVTLTKRASDGKYVAKISPAYKSVKNTTAKWTGTAAGKYTPTAKK